MEKSNQAEMARFLPRHRHLVVIFLLLLILAVFWIGFEWKLKTNFRHQPTQAMIDVKANINRRRDGLQALLNTSHLECDRILGSDAEYLKSKTGKHRWAMKADPERLDMDCEAIKARNGYLGQREISQQELDMPLAFARIVHRVRCFDSSSNKYSFIANPPSQDYFFLEMELLTNWVPQNWYCFVLDSKVDPKFRERMHSMAECFPNVFIAKNEFDVNRVGMNTSDAYLECAQELAKPERNW